MSTTEQPKQKRIKKVIPTCGICVESFNKSTRLLVLCPYCKYESCRTCWETYILNETSVKCMNPECAKPWTRKQIRDAFTLVFINGALKGHTEKVLFDKERALLPATQPIIEAKLEAKKISNQINEVYTEINILRKQVDDLCAQRSSILLRKPKMEPRAFVRACPDEECRGFLSTQWKCGICEKWTCPECHIIKGYTRDAEHTCKEDDVATARLISSDTKPCPNCGAGIFKIDGCDQMWCTQCQTAFSWRTGRIENNIHNPHYFEWMRRTGGVIQRNPLDTPCGRNLDHYLCEAFYRLLRTYYSTASNYRELLTRIDNTIRNAIHIRHAEQPHARTEHEYQRRNEDLRVRYLMKEITEEEMCDILQKDDKRYHRTQELGELFTLLGNTARDILYRFIEFLEENKNNKIQKIDDSILNEIDRIIEYSNECLADIAHTYSCSRIVINPTLQILRGQMAVNQLKRLKEAAQVTVV